MGTRRRECPVEVLIGLRKRKEKKRDLSYIVLRDIRDDENHSQDVSRRHCQSLDIIDTYAYILC